MHQTLAQLIQAANNIILGKEQQIRLSLCCLLTGGHLLIEDIPGVGKTTLAHTLAKLMGLEYQRIQFTSDLLPSDIIGATIYNPEQHQFTFHTLSAPDGMIVSRRRREICQSEVRDSARGRLKFYPE